MRPFAFDRPADADAAVAAAGCAADGEARYLGGGTNLVDLMRLGVERPAKLIHVARLPHRGVEELPDGGLRIGAATTNSELAADPLVRHRAPLLALAVLQGASGQVRNLATAGGNLLQRTRCPYFQDVSKPCNKRLPGSGCPARDGDHRTLAILGHSDACVATHPSDMAVALAALGATVHVEGPDGQRDVPIPGLHRLPGDAPHRDTVLEPSELITAISVAPRLPAAHARYRKVRERASFSFALVSVAVDLRVEGGVVQGSRVALGGVAHAPWRAWRVEESLEGRPATEETFMSAADAELANAEPLPDNAYKVALARNLIVRTLVDACV